MSVWESLSQSYGVIERIMKRSCVGSELIESTILDFCCEKVYGKINEKLKMVCQAFLITGRRLIEWI